MVKPLFSILLILSTIPSIAQTPEDFGFRHFQTVYNGDPVDILIKSKKGEEQVKKPLLLFCQGSLPIPLIIQYNENGQQGIFSVFPFDPESISQDYHLAIINKPFVPLIANESTLSKDLTYTDSLGKFPTDYTKRNFLDYYVQRNLHVINFLRKQSFIKTDKLVVAGHSEGSAIAANIASKSKAVTKLIYSGGSPLGRMMTIIQRERFEQLKDSTKIASELFEYWQKTVENRNVDDSHGDTFKGLYQFSYPPPIDILLKLKIPILVSYGTKDFGAVAQNDYLRISAIARKKQNFTFKDYPGLEHNYFPLLQNGQPNYEIFNWDKVAEDWRDWLSK